MKKTFLSLSVLGVLLLTGCASEIKYECGLTDLPAAKCASMEDTYRIGKADTKQKRQSLYEGVSDPKGAAVDSNEARPMFAAKTGDFPEPGQTGMPVFEQPKVHRAWVAPYVDADGNLRTGEYVYFSTPGRWNYGSTKQPGKAAVAFGPVKPGQLGFEVQNTNKSLNPSAQPAPPKPAAAPAQSGAKAPTKAEMNGITQPYQRLADE